MKKLFLFLGFLLISLFILAACGGEQGASVSTATTQPVQEPTATRILPTATAAPVATATPTPQAPPTEAATPTPAATEAATAPPSQAEAAFQIVTSDGQTKGLSLDDLKKLPMATITVDGKTEEGPALQEVLQSVGITEFRQVTVTGQEGGSLTLSKDQVTPDVVLDFTERGTMKFSSPAVPKKEWVKDIVTIQVE